MLGPVEVMGESGAIELGGPKPRALLAVLLINLGRWVSTDRLLDELWGDDPPASALNTLQSYLSRLRSGLGASRLVSGRAGYSLVAEGAGCDAVEFERLIEQAVDELDPAARRRLLIEGLSLWRGDPYEDVADTSAVTSERTRLRERWLVALEQRVDADLDLGQHQSLVSELERLVDKHPLREGLWAQLMLACYRSGRQADALAAYRKLRNILAMELGIEPAPEIRRLEERILLQDPALAHIDTHQFGGISIHWRGTRRQDKRHNFPSQLTSFIGRRRDLEELRSRVRQNRLVAVVGPGGAGKTRLALEAASGLIDEFPDGAWVVDLAPLTEPAQVVLQVAAALEVSQVSDRALDAVIAEALERAHVLLLLDNCEHLLAACVGLTNSLLHLVPGLHILVTSRQRLGIGGEQVWPIEGLALDPIDGEVSQGEAVQLFNERVRGLQPGYRPSEGEVALVADICVQLDGLPLAIELAAARVPGLGTQKLSARLGERFRLLNADDATAPPRLRSLLGTIAWSHGLLSPTEKVLFRRLAVFAGSFTLEAAEAVAGELKNVVDVLPRLAQRSLLATLPKEGGNLRYRFHESIRLYAYERLREADEVDAVGKAHSDHYARLAESEREISTERGSRLKELGGSKAIRTSLDRLELDLANLRAGLAWAIRNDQAETAILLADGIASLWIRGYVSEGLEALERSLSLKGAVAASIRAKALLDACYLSHASGQNQRAIALVEEARRCFQAAGDSRGEAYALSALGPSLWNRGEWDRAVTVSQEAFDLFSSVDDEKGAAECLVLIAAVAFRRADYRRAESLLGEVLAVARKADEPLLEGRALYDLGIIATRLGEYPRAREFLESRLRLDEAHHQYFIAHTLRDLALLTLYEGNAAGSLPVIRRSLELERQFGDIWGAAASLQVEAKVLLAMGDQQRAGEAASESVELFHQLGDPWFTAASLLVLGMVNLTRGELGDGQHFLTEALETFGQLGDLYGVAESLETMAEAFETSNSEFAATLLGGAESIRDRIGAPIPAISAGRRTVLETALRETLGAERYEQFRAVGIDVDPKDLLARARRHL